MSENDDIHAAVHAAAFRGEIGCDRVILGESGGAQTIGTEAVADHEQPHDFGRPAGGEFPVRGKLGGVNGGVIGVALDAQTIVALPEHVRNAVEGGLRTGLHLG